MYSVIIYLLLFGAFIVSLVAGYKFLSKMNFQLNGLEVYFLQISFILIFFGIQYDGESYYEILILLGFFSLIYLAYYYLLRMIKSKFYIKWPMFIIYIIMFIANAYSLKFIPMSGWEDLGYAIIFILFSGSVLLYLLLINLITFIIRKVKKITSNNYNFFLKKEVLISLILLAVFLPIFYGLNYENRINYELDKKEESISKKGLDYLNKKYGNGNFQIIQSECSSSRYENDCELEISTNYFDGTFEIDINTDDYKVYYDEFIFKYYSSIYHQNIEDYYELETYLEQEYLKEYLTNDDYAIEIKGFYFDSTLYEEAYLGDVPTLENLKKFIEVKSEEVLIYKVFTESESKEFCEFIINLYEELNYEEDILWFRFNYDNPFSSSLYYKDDGYLRNAGEYWYYVYVDATPIHVKK